MALTTAVVNAAVDAATALLPYMSLHSSTPDGSGSNECSGGSYARQAITYNAASGGSATLTGNVTFSGTANSAVSHVGFWSASTSGTFRGSKALTGDTTFNASGQYVVTAATIVGSAT